MRSDVFSGAVVDAGGRVRMTKTPGTTGNWPDWSDWFGRASDVAGLQGLGVTGRFPRRGVEVDI